MCFHFKKELDTTELLKWSIATFGIVVSFLLVEYASFKIEVAKIKKEALQEIVKYSPRIRSNFTNELQEDRLTLIIKVFLVPKSVGELYVFKPSLSIYDEQGEELPEDKYLANDIGQFQGSFPPGEPYEITYTIKFHEQLNPSKVELKYLIQTADKDAHPMIWYAKELQKIPVVGSSQTIKQDEIEKFYSKEVVYNERIYTKGTNPIWDDFWEKPR